jgi:hypothetical protein
MSLTSCGAGVLRIDQDTAEVESEANFGSAMASVGVIKGKWMCASPVVGHLCLALHFVIGSL